MNSKQAKRIRKYVRMINGYVFQQEGKNMPYREYNERKSMVQATTEDDENGDPIFVTKWFPITLSDKCVRKGYQRIKKGFTPMGYLKEQQRMQAESVQTVQQ